MGDKDKLQEYKSPWGEDAISEIIRKGMSGAKPVPKQPPLPASSAAASEPIPPTEKPKKSRSKSQKRAKKSRSKSKDRSRSRRKKERSRSKSGKKRDRSRSRRHRSGSRGKDRRSRSRGKKHRSRSKGKKERRSRSNSGGGKARSRSKKRDHSRSKSHKSKRDRSRSKPRKRSKSRSNSREDKREKAQHSRRSRSDSRSNRRKHHKNSPSGHDKRRRVESGEEDGRYEPHRAQHESSSEEEKEEEEEEEGEQEGQIDPVPECPNTANKYHRCTAWCAKHWKAVKLAEALPAPEPLPVLPMPRRAVAAISATGSCSDRGMRSVNEDMLWVVPSFKVPGQSLTPHPLCFLGVFDGHSGSGTVNYVHKAVQAFLKLHLGKGETMEEALLAAFKDTNANVLKDGSGSTACCVLVCKGTGRMWTANCGDSRAILSQSGKPIQLTRDHKVSDPEEQKRLQALGAEFVESNGAQYVKYHKPDVRLGLSVARSLGDHHFNEEKDIISGTPDLTARLLGPSDDFLVVACDGLWDVMDNQAVTDFVGGAIKAGEALDSIAASLAKKATSLGSADNISVIIATI